MNPKPASMFAFSRPSCKTDTRCCPLPAPRVHRQLGRGSDLAFFPGIWTHSFCRLLLNAYIAAVAHHLRADLDQLVLQTRQRPILDRLGRRQRPQEIAEIVGERMKLEPHG